MIQFGAGRVFVQPVGGNLPTNPTPFQGQTTQEFSIDIEQKLVQLMGQLKFADDIAPSDMSVKGKFTVGRQDFRMFNQLMFADVESVGGAIPILNEPHSVPSPSGPYTVTVTGSATFSVDQGVTYASAPPAGNTQQLKRVTGTPTTGQYSVSAGVYSFAAADAGIGVLISYTETNNAAGYTISMNNQLQGFGPVCSLLFAETYTGASNATYQPASIYLPAVRFSKINQDFKRNEYAKPQLEFEAFANPAGLVAQFVNLGAA